MVRDKDHFSRATLLSKAAVRTSRSFGVIGSATFRRKGDTFAHFLHQLRGGFRFPFPSRLLFRSFLHHHGGRNRISIVPTGINNTTIFHPGDVRIHTGTRGESQFATIASHSSTYHPTSLYFRFVARLFRRVHRVDKDFGFFRPCFEGDVGVIGVNGCVYRSFLLFSYMERSVGRQRGRFRSGRAGRYVRGASRRGRKPVFFQCVNGTRRPTRMLSLKDRRSRHERRGHRVFPVSSTQHVREDYRACPYEAKRPNNRGGGRELSQRTRSARSKPRPMSGRVRGARGVWGVNSSVNRRGVQCGILYDRVPTFSNTTSRSVGGVELCLCQSHFDYRF